MCAPSLRQMAESEDAAPVGNVEIDRQIFVDQGNRDPTAEEVQDFVVENPVGDQAKGKNHESCAEQIAVGSALFPPRAGGLHIPQDGEFEYPQQQGRQGQGVEHEEDPCEVVDRGVP